MGRIGPQDDILRPLMKRSFSLLLVVIYYGIAHRKVLQYQTTSICNGMFQEEEKSGVSFFTSYQTLFHVGFKERVQMWPLTLIHLFTEKYSFVLKVFVIFRDTFLPLCSCTLESFSFLFLCLLWLPRTFYIKLSRSSKHCKLLCAYMSSTDLNVSRNLYSLFFLLFYGRKGMEEMSLPLRFSTLYICVLSTWFNKWQNKGICAVCVFGCLVMR